jgi:uncharacterized protein (DUF2235 family)
MKTLCAIVLAVMLGACASQPAATSAPDVAEIPLRGDNFVAQHYRPGDRLFILGFSRGAHQARALAGLLAYSGLPATLSGDAGQRQRLENRILEIVKRKEDVDYVSKWQDCRPDQPPLLAAEISSALGVPMRSAEISVLGVWDTVPGSSLKDFDGCKERPDGKPGDRYKSDSYPPIRHIAHAVSRDEKRSRFQPILLCRAIAPVYTEVNELWFPGAHADVGSGYENNHDLANRPFNWMQPPPGAADDESAGARTRAANAPLRVQGQVQPMKYPVSCSMLPNKSAH